MLTHLKYALYVLCCAALLSSCTDEFTRNYTADHVYFVAEDTTQQGYIEYHAGHTFHLDQTDPPIDPQKVINGKLVYANIHGSFQNEHLLPDSVAIYFAAPSIPLELVAFGKREEKNDSLLVMRTLKDSNLQNMFKQHNVLMIAKAWSKQPKMPSDFGGRFEFEVTFEQ
jgi:hypothetical protein